MARLVIRLLGPLEVILDGQPVTGFRSDKVQALLAYLAVEADRPHPRRTLAALLWPDQPEAGALGNLSNALSNLNRLLDNPHADPPFLFASREIIRFNPDSDYWLDVDDFQRAISDLGLMARESRQRRTSQIENLKSAINVPWTLAAGPFRRR